LLHLNFKAKKLLDIPLPKVANGIYIVQIKTTSGIINKKITIE